MNTPTQHHSNESTGGLQPPQHSWLAPIIFTIIALIAIGLVASKEGIGADLGVLVADPDFLSWLGKAALLSVALAVALTTLALIVASLGSAGRDPVRPRISSTGVAVQMCAGAMLSVPLYITLLNIGALNARFGALIIAALTALPFAIWQLKRGYESIPPDLYDIARIDGCSSWQLFRAVTFPTIRRPLLVAAFFCFMTAWNLIVIARLLLARLGGNDGSFTASPSALGGAVLLVSIPLLISFAVLSIYPATASRRRARE